MYEQDLTTQPYPALACDDDTLNVADTQASSQVLGSEVGSDIARAEPAWSEPAWADQTWEELPPPDIGLQSTTLPVDADLAFELFSASERTAEWVSIVSSATVLRYDTAGRPLRTAFIARLERASMGYTLEYTYDPVAREVHFASASDTELRLGGMARFQALGPRACLMQYDLRVYSQSHLPRWGDALYNGHPTSAVLADFREFVTRHRDL